MTAKAGVVGWPIAHSLSPVLHGHWLKQYGIDGSYERVAIEPGSFPQRIADLRAAGFRGVNVTVPYKEEAFALAHRTDDAARQAGAVNLLVFHADGVEGRNTDSLGLAESLRKSLGENAIKGRKVVLLGAGGAARGAILALEMLGAESIHILNRSVERAMILAKTMENGTQLFPDPLSGWEDVARNAVLLVNSTSAGMAGNAPLELDLSPLPKDAAVCDIVYNPLETDLLRRAAARGHKTVDGLGMLMHQAVPSFEAFFGVKPQVTPALRAALIGALNAR